MNRILCLLLFVPLFALQSSAQEKWTPLFDGTSMDAWTQKGGKATFEAKDSAIAGIAVLKTPNSFLCTKKMYGDFEFECEFKADKLMNSGIMFRANEFPEATTVEWKGKTVKVAANRVHGYQCELEQETRDRWWSTGIYDEARRGWIFPDPSNAEAKAEFAKVGKAAWKLGEWNRIKIRCEGDHIQTWLNGEPRTDFKDSMTAKGFIGLQVHSIKKDTEGATVYWRNLKIRELGKSPE